MTNVRVSGSSEHTRRNALVLHPQHFNSKRQRGTCSILPSLFPPTKKVWGSNDNTAGPSPVARAGNATTTPRVRVRPLAQATRQQHCGPGPREQHRGSGPSCSRREEGRDNNTAGPGSAASAGDTTTRVDRNTNNNYNARLRGLLVPHTTRAAPRRPRSSLRMREFWKSRKYVREETLVGYLIVVKQIR